MIDNYFLNEEPRPDAAAIESALGDKYPWYEGVLGAANGFELDWKHYGKKYGWKLKAHDGNKALFELTVSEGRFRLGMAVREAELLAMRADPGLADGLAGLLDPGTSREGWGIRVTVEDEGSYGLALLLIRAVTDIRSRS